MSNPYQFYLKYINAKTGFRATWDPGRPLKIGQIGKLDSTGIFTVYSSLENEGIRVEINPLASPGELDYTSHESVSMVAKLSGKAPEVGSAFTKADAGFSFVFKKEDSIVFQASGCRTSQIVNTGKIEQAVLKKYNRGNWEKDWLIIAQVIEVESATILISNNSNTVLELKASAKVNAAIRLTDASLKLAVAREQGSVLKYITQAGISPLYRLMGISDPYFGNAKLTTKGALDEGSNEKFFYRDFKETELG